MGERGEGVAGGWGSLLSLAASLPRYASLYFLACVDEDDNELIVLETIHHFVEVSRARVVGG